MRPCASPHAPVAGHGGACIRLDVRRHWSREHLLIVALRRAAYPKRFAISRHRRHLSASIAFVVLRWALCNICAVRMPTKTGTPQPIAVRDRLFAIDTLKRLRDFPTVVEILEQGAQRHDGTLPVGVQVPDLVGPM